MSATEPSCDRRRLDDLLAGRLDPASEAEAERHLADCPGCRRRLETLAAGGDWWADLRHLGDGEPDPADSAAGARSDLAGLLEPADDPGLIGRLGAYEVSGVLGRGGMGVVLRGYDPTLCRPVAIKVIAPALAGSAAARRRFVREARAAAAVAHEHVVAIHAVAESAAGLPYLVMPLIAGRSLQERIDAEGPPALAEILRIGMQAAAGLAGAHAQGLVHRDIKPANILLENGVERVKITDFGLARVADDASLSQSGVVVGTPEYMSPEQARGEALDSRSDLFSLGAVLYAMATGHPPFRAPSALATLRRIADDAPRPVREVNPALPDWLEVLIARLLAKDPADRFGSAREVADLLGRHLAALQGLHRPAPVDPRGAPTAAVAIARRPRRRPILIAAGVGLVAAALGIGLAEAAGARPMATLVATILRFATPEGTLVVAVDDPAVAVALDGEALVITGAGPQAVRLRVGEHRVRATRDGRPILDELVTITRDNRPIVSVRREAPPAGPTAPPPPPASPKPEAPPVVAAPVVAASAPAPAPLPAVDPAAGTVVTIPDNYRPGPSRPAPPGGGTGTKTVIAGPTVPGLDQPGALRPVPLDEASPVPLWPGSSVTYLAYSPDGRTLAVASNFPRQILLFDAATRQPGPILSGHSARVWGMAFSPDGRSLAASSGDWGYPARSGKVHLWDLDRPDRADRPARLVAEVPLAFALAFSPDSRTLAYGGWDDLVTLYDLTDRKVRATARGHEDAVRSVAFSPDGRTLASGGVDRTVRFWDPTTGQAVGEPLGPYARQVNHVAYSPDGRALAVVAANNKTGDAPDEANRVVVVDPESRAVRLELRDPSPVIFFAAFSPDGRTLASAGGRKDAFGHVKLWDATTGAERRTLGGFRSWVGCVAFAPDGRSLVACSDHGGRVAEVRAWELVPLFAPEGRTVAVGDAPAWALAFDADPRRPTLVVGGGPITGHGRVRLLDRAEGPGRVAYRSLLGVRSLAYAADVGRLAAGSFDGALAVGDTPTGPWRTIPAHSEAVNAVAITRDGRAAATAGRDGWVRTWDAATGRLRTEVRPGEAWSLAFVPDGSALILGLADGTVARLDLANGRRQDLPGRHERGVTALGFGPDGRTLASAGWDRTVLLREAFDGGEPRVLRGHDRPIRALAFSPDGRLLATADGSEEDPTEPGTVRLWDVPSGAPRGLLRAARSRLWAVCFAPDGRTLAAGGDDGTITFWTRADATADPAGRP